MYRESLALPPLQSTIFVDDTLIATDRFWKRFFLLLNVDPSKKAQYRSLEELTDPIKVVIYMGGHEAVDRDHQADRKTNKATLSAIMRMKNASISIQQTRIKRQP